MYELLQKLIQMKEAAENDELYCLNAGLHEAKMNELFTSAKELMQEIQ